MNVLIWYWGRETSKYTLELLRALRDLPDLNLVLSCSEGSDLHHGASQIEGLPIVPVTTFIGVKQSWRGRLSALRGVLALPRTMLRFRRLLRQYQIDVAVCAQGAVWNVAAIPALTRGRVRYVQVIHELISHPGETYPLRDKMTFRHIAVADGIVVLSDQIRRQVIDRFYCPPERCWKMPLGALVFGTQPLTAAVHPRGRRPLHLLFFGRISRYKGLDRLFGAMHLLRQRDLRCKLVIAGSGSLDGFQEQIAAPDIEVHNSWLDEEQIAALMSASDLVVLPYELSSQSGVAAAAHAAGRPVVATPIGGLREQVLPGTGLLARDMSVEAFADALTELITDPVLFDRCAAGALQHAQTELDWHKCAEVLHESVQQVCAMPRRTASKSRALTPSAPDMRLSTGRSA